MIGISHVETALPKARMTVEDMARTSGISAVDLREELGLAEKPILDAGETVIELAIRAARRALDVTQTNPNQIDYIIHCSCGVQDRLLWSPAAKIQKEIGATRAFSFDIQNGCNSGNLGVQLAHNQLISEPDKQVVLVVIADALSSIVDYQDKRQSCIFPFADAASALLVKKGESKNQLLAFAASTNAIFADHMGIGRKAAFIAMNDDEDEDRALGAEYRARYPGMIRQALAKAGLEVEDVDHLFMNQGDHKLIRRLSEALPLAPEKIHRTHESFGHLGGTDVFFGLEQRAAEGRLKPGDVCVLASSAVGFSWGATVLRA